MEKEMILGARDLPADFSLCFFFLFSSFLYCPQLKSHDLTLKRKTSSCFHVLNPPVNEYAWGYGP